jgi:hypothetical protein
VARTEHTVVGRPAPGGDVTELDAGFPVELDPSKPLIVSSFGRKGSGKSTFNRRLYDSWPGDKLAIDVNGDADPGPDAVAIHTPLPSKFPAPPVGLLGSPRPGPQNLTFRADPGSETYTDDLDRAVGLALFPQAHPTMVWCGEAGEFMPNAQTTRPHMRRLLKQNRHYHVTALFDDPRPKNVNPLVIGQSDLVAVYELPNPADRVRVAETIGYPPARFDKEMEETLRRGPYWFLLWVAAAHKLYRCAPLPTD